MEPGIWTRCLTIGMIFLLVGGCSSSETVIGQPTPLNGRDPIAWICEIQGKKTSHYPRTPDYIFDTYKLGLKVRSLSAECKKTQ